MSTPNEIGSWYSTRTLVLTYIFIIWTKIGRGGHPGPPQEGSPPQKLKKYVLGHVTYQSKAHEKLYSNMSIECSFDHSFDRQQLKMTGKSFFITVFFRGACPHRMRYEADFLHGYWFWLIFSYHEPKFAGDDTWPPPGGGEPPQKLKKHVYGHVTYQSKAHEKLYSNMSIECSFDHSSDLQQLKITGKWPKNNI